ncbi:MAG: type II toxin-antitoxin system HicA family toxin [Desulfitobacteriaceae bacterium]|nr:type II toxin-antitoxin system HicA family toxin [Desulfitobacteriaceae bacterium]MDD4402354.1 type II toxin-antitoxin system HicA family toxin [Desulfitobacteriaceae bacterium]
MPKKLKQLLREAGCSYVRHGKGDHQIWYSPVTKINFVVDTHIKSRHTANGVLKQAGLPKQF